MLGEGKGIALPHARTILRVGQEHFVPEHSPGYQIVRMIRT